MQDQNQAPSAGTNVALLQPPERAQIALESSKTEKHLRDLVSTSAGILTVADGASREEAHRAAMNLRNARTAITKAGKAARDDANAFCAAVITEEKRLVAIVTPEEERVFGLRDGYDAKVKAEKEEAERRERERVAAIRAKIEGIRGLPAASFRDSAEQIAATMADLEAFEMSEAEFAEFAGEASAVKAQAMEELRTLHATAVEAEAAAARVAAERERQAAAARKAEEDRLKAEREAFEAERRAFQEQQAAAACAAQPASSEEPATDVTASCRAAPMNLEIATAPAVLLTTNADLSTEQQPLAPVVQDETAVHTLDDCGRIGILRMTVADLLTIGFSADAIREVFESALVAALDQHQEAA